MNLKLPVATNHPTNISPSDIIFNITVPLRLVHIVNLRDFSDDKHFSLVLGKNENHFPCFHSYLISVGFKQFSLTSYMSYFVNFLMFRLYFRLFNFPFYFKVPILPVVTKPVVHFFILVTFRMLSADSLNFHPRVFLVQLDILDLLEFG